MEKSVIQENPSQDAEPVPQPPDVRRKKRWLINLFAVLLAIFFAGLGYFFYIQNNDFPYWYHPDEFKKGYFIMNDQQVRTFAHPALLLETGNLVRQWMGVVGDQQEAVRCGRYASALLAAIGVFGFSLAGYRIQGFIGLVLCGSAMALCPPLLVHAHYFKEDTALLAGIGISTLGLTWVAGGDKKLLAQMISTAVLGLGCAMAASGKYVGAVMIVPALVALIIARSGRPWHIFVRLGTFIAITTIVILIINFRAISFDGPIPSLAPGITQNIEYEVDHGFNGHYNIALNIPNTFALRIAISDLMPHVWILGGIGLLWCIVRLKISRAGLVIGLCPIIWIAALSLNAIPIPRYGLPISVLIFFGSTLLISRAIIDWKNSRKWVGITSLVVVSITIVHFQMTRCRSFDEQFANDSRQALRNWIAGHLQPGTRLPVDSYTGLAEPGDMIRHPGDPSIDNIAIEQSMFAADAATTPVDLANMGVEYVAVAWPGYMRFLDPEVHGWPADSSAGIRFEQRKAFYQELFKKGEIVFQLKPDPPTHSYVNPEVAVYKISKLATGPIRPQHSPQEESRPPLILRMFGF